MGLLYKHMRDEYLKSVGIEPIKLARNPEADCLLIISILALCYLSIAY